LGGLTGAAALALFAMQADPAVLPAATVPPPAATVVAPAREPAATTVPAEPPANIAEPAALSPPAAASGAEPQAAPLAADGTSSTIVVTAKPKDDPLLGVNATAFHLTDDIDKALVGPIADAYKKALPKPARAGLHNFIRNVGSPIVFINDLLQLRPKRALRTLGRFVVNTTLGLGGLIDVANNKPFHIPYHPNGFADTLGYYGVKPGPYLYLPLIGPTAVRDILGGAVDGLILPYGIGAPFNKLYYTLPNGVIRSLDRRVEFDCQIEWIRNSGDPYAAERTVYLNKRQAEIDALHAKGNGPDGKIKCETAPAAAPVTPEPMPEPAPEPAPATVPVAPETAPAPPPPSN
jgi:phospholipid-binding lipoprotein MlaA